MAASCICSISSSCNRLPPTGELLRTTAGRLASACGFSSVVVNHRRKPSIFSIQMWQCCSAGCASADATAAAGAAAVDPHPQVATVRVDAADVDGAGGDGADEVLLKTLFTRHNVSTAMQQEVESAYTDSRRLVTGAWSLLFSE